MQDPATRQGFPGQGGMEDPDEMPEHEIDREPTVGGGVMEQGGTAVDRGTGTLGGQAQNRDDDDGDEADSGEADAGDGDPLNPRGLDPNEVEPSPQMGH